MAPAADRETLNDFLAAAAAERAARAAAERQAAEAQRAAAEEEARQARMAELDRARAKQRAEGGCSGARSDHTSMLVCHCPASLNVVEPPEQELYGDVGRLCTPDWLWTYQAEQQALQASCLQAAS